MVPTTHKGLHRYEYGHDVEGNMYKLKIRNKDNKELSRTATGERLVWESVTPANFGIKVAKRVSGNSPEFMKHFKAAAWDNKDMKDYLAKRALKAVKKPKK